MKSGEKMKEFIVTSESVTEGHPDKVCDQISDAILDAYLLQDKDSRVAVETMISHKLLIIAGEVTSKGQVDVEAIAKKTLERIGYTSMESGFDFDQAIVITNLVNQSLDIARGVNKDKICAGDQGIVFGYASRQADNLMPYSIDFAHRLAARLSYVRKKNLIPGLYPDGKSQVTVRYGENNQLIAIDNIVIAAQHREDVENLKVDILKEVILKVIDPKYIDINTKIYINQTGKFVKGGPGADSGLTGRKIIVDTYGGVGRHGGGAFSGKDPSKADRSGAYMARYMAKNLVASGLVDECEVGLSFVIGKEEAASIEINTFGSEKIDKKKIEEIVGEVFDLSIDSIIKNFDLQRPIYSNIASYGQMGRREDIYLWERTDKKDEIRNLAGLSRLA